MRLRLPTVAVPLIPLATFAVCAGDPVADPGSVRISYEQRSWVDAGAPGGLARRHSGWVRALDAGAVAQPPPPAAPPAMVDDEY